MKVKEVKKQRDNHCVVCGRIRPRFIFVLAHRLFDQSYGKKTAWLLAKIAVEIINYADENNRLFFCEYSRRALIASLLFIISVKTGLNEVCEKTIHHRLWQRSHSISITYVPKFQINGKPWGDNEPLTLRNQPKVIYEKTPSELKKIKHYSLGYNYFAEKSGCAASTISKHENRWLTAFPDLFTRLYYVAA